MEYMTAPEVMEMLKIHRSTLWRMVYQRRSLPAFHKPGSKPGKTKRGKRRPNRLLFLKKDVEKLVTQVTPDSERHVKRVAKKSSVLKS